MKVANTVTAFMKDLSQENEPIIDVEMCISNVMVSDSSAVLNWECHILGNNAQIIEKLNKWIKERGNDFCNAILDLVSYRINYIEVEQDEI